MPHLTQSIESLELWVPLLSLVDADGNPQEDLISAHLQWLQGYAIDGLLVMGTTGEFASFSVAQRNNYLSAVTRHNPGFPLMVNIGANNLADITTLQTFALNQPGVEKTLWMPPFYFPQHDVNGLEALLQQVIDNQTNQLPLYWYHYPKMGKIDISHAFLERFPRIEGLKDSSGDFNHIAELTKAFPRLKIYAGTDGQIDASIKAGAAGIVSALANIFPQLSTAAILGSHQAQSALQQLRSALPSNAKVPAIKAYLNHLQLSPQTAHCVLPYTDLSNPEAAEIVSQLKALIPQAVSHAL